MAFNDNDEMLLAQRAVTKRYDGGKWGPSAAGTVEQGENYETNIYKEAAEELGLRDEHFITGPKFLVDDNGYGHGYYCQTYLALVSLPVSAFKLEPAEVQQVRWWPIHELRQAVIDHPGDFTAQFAPRLVTMLSAASTL